LAQVIYSENALTDLERLFNFLLEHNPSAALSAAETITDAVTTLKTHPLIGRCIEDEIRELIISYGKSGYVALYRFVPTLDQIRVLAIRHQQELDYPA
jgi:addiction module RelE/StbE family toxin